MTQPGRLISISLVCLPLIGIVSFACSAEPACDCANAGVTILATRGDVVAISTSGAACSGGEVICVSTNDRAALVGCEQWIVIPTGNGTCHIDASLSDGSTRPADFEIIDRATDSCCSGLYTIGDGTFVVARPDAAVRDAGGD